MDSQKRLINCCNKPRTNFCAQSNAALAAGVVDLTASADIDTTAVSAAQSVEEPPAEDAVDEMAAAVREVRSLDLGRANSANINSDAHAAPAEANGVANSSPAEKLLRQGENSADGGDVVRDMLTDDVGNMTVDELPVTVTDTTLESAAVESCDDDDSDFSNVFMSLMVDAQAAAEFLSGEGGPNSSTVSPSAVRSSLLKMLAPALAFVDNTPSIAPAIRRAAKEFHQAILLSRKRKQTKIVRFFKRRDGLNISA